MNQYTINKLGRNQTFESKIFQKYKTTAEICPCCLDNHKCFACEKFGFSKIAFQFFMPSTLNERLKMETHLQNVSWKIRFFTSHIVISERSFQDQSLQTKNIFFQFLVFYQRLECHFRMIL